MLITSKVVFKDYAPNQISLLPPSLDELIEANHPVRTVSTIIDELDLEPLIKSYQGGGTSSYHPKMLLKVLVYGYLCNLFSSRKLEAAIKENIHFMWLTGMKRPDHNTINRFRSERLKDEIRKVFTQIVLLLESEGHVSLQTVFVDGTKIEANASRYSFVWGNAIKTNKARIATQLQELWEYTQTVADQEKNIEPVDFAEINPEKVAQAIDQIDELLKGKKIDKKVRQKLGYARKNWSVNLSKYEDQQGTLDGRNSYSKTDTDATFMRMKEDHMRNGQLKPAYNLQISTHNQFIVHFSLHHNPTDTRTLEAHVEGFKSQYKKVPQELVADAGYGSEQNYLMLEGKGIESYVKYNYFDKDRHKKDQSDPVTKSPNSPQIGELRTKAYKKLITPRGIALRKQRCHDVETVFAEIKHNKGFRRFNLRGKTKAEVETGLIAIAHNLKKISKKR